MSSIPGLGPGRKNLETMAYWNVYKDRLLISLCQLVYISSFGCAVVSAGNVYHPQPFSLEEELTVEEGSLVPTSGTMELDEGEIFKDEPREKVSRFTEHEPLPKVARPGMETAPADPQQPATSTPARSGPAGMGSPSENLPSAARSTPASKGTPGPSREEKKKEKRAARKAEKIAKKEQKRNKAAGSKEAETPKTASKPTVGEDAEGSNVSSPAPTQVRRKLDEAMAAAGCVQNVMLLEVMYKRLSKDKQYKPDFVSLFNQMLENHEKFTPRQVYRPLPGEADHDEERKELSRMATEATVEEAEDQATQERKRKLEELEQQQRNLAEETKRLRELEKAEARAKELREKQKKKITVPTARTEEPADWFGTRSKEMVKRIVDGFEDTQHGAAEAEQEYKKAVRLLEKSQSSVGSAYQQYSAKVDEMQKSMAKALTAAVAVGEARATKALYAKVRDSVTVPAAPGEERKSKSPQAKKMPKLPETAEPGEKKEGGKAKKLPASWEDKPQGGKGMPKQYRVRMQPPEEEPGKEWRERYYTDEWKLGQKLKKGEKYLDCAYPPFSEGWLDNVRKLLLELSHRGMGEDKEGEKAPSYPYPWTFASETDYLQVEARLAHFGLRLTERGQDCKGRGRSLEHWHLNCLGRGKLEKEWGTILSAFPPSRNLCSVCWHSGHWRDGCPAKEICFRAWEPSLVILEPREKTRKFWPARSVVARDEDTENVYERCLPSLVLLDCGAVDEDIQYRNRKLAEKKKKNPSWYPQMEYVPMETIDLEEDDAPGTAPKAKPRTPSREELKAKYEEHAKQKLKAVLEARVALEDQDPVSTEKPTEKPVEKPTEKPTEKPAEKPMETPSKKAKTDPKSNEPEVENPAPTEVPGGAWRKEESEAGSDERMDDESESESSESEDAKEYDPDSAEIPDIDAKDL